MSFRNPNPPELHPYRMSPGACTRALSTSWRIGAFDDCKLEGQEVTT
ncbi:MAG: hypothetical protein HYZ29_07400 [Myxococcales bacterium]|nr:hypothetical protein [Myxococcales bacterium]